MQCVPAALFPAVKRPGREADHLPPPSAEVKNSWNLPPLPQYASMAWYFVKHGDNFTFTFTRIIWVEFTLTRAVMQSTRIEGLPVSYSKFFPS
jgi:hypothetical protein